MIDLDRDGDVRVLRMAEGENRFNWRWQDAVNAALDRVEAAGGPAALVTTGERKFYTTAWAWTAGDHQRGGCRIPGGGEPAVRAACGLSRGDGGGGQRSLLRRGHGAGGCPRRRRHAAGQGLLVPARGGSGFPGDARDVCRHRREAAGPDRPGGRPHRPPLRWARRRGGGDRAPGGERGGARAGSQLAPGLAGKERRTLAEHKRMPYGEAIKVCEG